VELAEAPQRRFTVGEYFRMADAGILAPAERVELIRGTVREMSPRNRAHVVAVQKIRTRLEHVLGDRATVYPESPLLLEKLDSAPEPDVMVSASADFDDYGTDAARPLLVVEVADSSLKHDLGEKARLYAEAGVPEYWVLNLVDRVLVVFRDPRDGRYQAVATLPPAERVAPSRWSAAEIQVASFLPSASR
jgi:Uma2 family endonuclease